MRLLVLAAVIGVLAGGCGQSTVAKRGAADGEMFGPAGMRVHPIFTQVKDWTGDSEEDGIETLVEFQDQFGDPTKASGTLIFELYEYRRADPDPRGIRLAYWNSSVITLEDQRLRWNRTSRTYGFQLAYPKISDRHTYVLTAMFESSAGGRFFDRLVIEAQPEETHSVTQPASAPTSRIPQP